MRIDVKFDKIWLKIKSLGNLTKKYIENILIITTFILVIAGLMGYFYYQIKTFLIILFLGIILFPITVIVFFINNKGLFTKMVIAICFSCALVAMFILFGQAAIQMEQVMGIDRDSWLNFFGSLFGATAAVLGAYITTLIINATEDKEKVKIAELIVVNFLRHEIVKNLDMIKRSSNCANILENNSDKAQCSIKFKFCYDEFDKVKYEFLKYNNSTVKEVLEIYKLFYMLGNFNDINQMTSAEFDEVQSLYWKYENKY